MQCIRDTVRPTLLCKMMLKSISDCYFAEEAYRSLSMSLAVGKSPTAISTHVMSPYCPSNLFPQSKGCWCAGGWGSEAVKKLNKSFKHKELLEKIKLLIQTLAYAKLKNVFVPCLDKKAHRKKTVSLRCSKTFHQVISFKKEVNT